MTRTHANIIDPATAEVLASDLPLASTGSSEGVKRAQQLAADLGRTLLLLDSDGTWRVYPNGELHQQSDCPTTGSWLDVIGDLYNFRDETASMVSAFGLRLPEQSWLAVPAADRRELIGYLRWAGEHLLGSEAIRSAAGAAADLLEHFGGKS